MTTQTVRGALAKRDNIAMTQISAYREDFATMLPSHLRAATWVRGAQGLLRKDAKLRRVADANPASFLSALLDCARWGLDPGVTYHLVPFGNEIVGIRDYKGIIELMYRAGAVSSVKAEVVYAKDYYDYDQESQRPPTHKPAGSNGGQGNWFASREERGEMVGAYAYALMKDGSVSQVVNMAKWEIEEHKAASKTAHLADSMWQKWPRSAWKKTVARELEKWVPSSPEWITHKVRAERAGEEPDRQLSAAALALPPPVIDDEVIDGEVIASDPPSPPARPPAAAAARPVNKGRMNYLFGLLAKGNVKNKDARLRLAAHVLELDTELASFTDLTAEQVDSLIERLEQLDTDGQLGTAAPAADASQDVPAEQSDQPTATEGDNP